MREHCTQSLWSHTGTAIWWSWHVPIGTTDCSACNQSIPQLTNIYWTPRKHPGSHCPHQLFLRAVQSLLTPLRVFRLAPAPIKSILYIETRVDFPKIYKLDQVADLLKMLRLMISVQIKPTLPSMTEEVNHNLTPAWPCFPIAPASDTPHSTWPQYTSLSGASEECLRVLALA